MGWGAFFMCHVTAEGKCCRLCGKQICRHSRHHPGHLQYSRGLLPAPPLPSSSLTIYCQQSSQGDPLKHVTSSPSSGSPNSLGSKPRLSWAARPPLPLQPRRPCRPPSCPLRPATPSFLLRLSPLSAPPPCDAGCASLSSMSITRLPPSRSKTAGSRSVLSVCFAHCHFPRAENGARRVVASQPMLVE